MRIELPRSADVVVLGAGINGAACAAALAREAMKLWQEAGEEASGEDDFELIFGGNLYICNDERELPLLRRLVAEAHAAGLDRVDLLTPEQARDLMPAAEGDFISAMWSPSDGHCQPDKATRFFVRKAEHAGTKIAYSVKGTRALERYGRVSGVETDSGRVEASAVVLAAGVWTPYLTSTVGVRVPIMPVTLSEVETFPLPPLFEQTIRAHGFGGFQRPNGQVVLSRGLNAVVGHAVTLYDLLHLPLWAPRLAAFRKDLRLSLDMERIFAQIRAGSSLSTELIPKSSPEPEPNRASLDDALARAGRLIPGMREALPARYWGGLIDMSPDGLPIIDGSAGPEGLSFITGLSGHGLTLAPVSGEILADLALDRRTSRPIHPFRLARFKEPTVPIPGKLI